MIPTDLPPTDGPPSRPEPYGPFNVPVPQLKIRQEGTRNADGVPLGSLFLSSDPTDHAPAREVVLIGARRERALFLPHDGGAADELVRRVLRRTGVDVTQGERIGGPVCVSPDRVTLLAGYGRVALAEDCRSCPMAGWRTVDGRRVQDCAEGYGFLFLDLLGQVPAVFHARGSALPPMSDLLTSLQVASRRERRPFFALSFSFSTRSATHEESGHTYFVPTFTAPEPIDDDELRTLCADMVTLCTDLRPRSEEERS